MQSHNTITVAGFKKTADPSVEVTIPRELGPVRLLHEIGRGGMGVVYLGRHKMLDRDVAVKFLLHAVAGPDDPGFAGFLEGTRAAAKVEHPGLTTIHHADVVDGIPYLVMQYIDGPTLGDVLKQTGPLSSPASIAVLDAVSEAIGELHDREIVHRDIKPANILLDREGHVFVTDFGLACSRPRAQRGQTSTGLAGTPSYMAPEMFDGVVSLRSDVYALGITSFELLTGKSPFGGTLDEVRKKHFHEALPVELLQEQDVATELIEVIERATHKDAMYRYKTARHFQTALKSGVATEEVLHEGASELHRVVARSLHKDSDATTPETAEKSPTSTYFARLSEIAGEKRAAREPSDKADLESPPRDESAEALSPPTGDQPVEASSIPGPPSAELARAAALVADVPCVKCNYNLRGLIAGGRCPECGEAVAASLGPQRLMFAPGSWLARSAAGLTVIIWALGIGVPLTICLIRIGIAIGQRAASSELIDGTLTVRLPPNVYLGIGLATILTTFVAFAIGLLMATRREPQVCFAGDTDTVRRAARLLLVLFPATFALLQFFPLPTLPSGPQFRHELAMLLLGSAVLSFVQYLAVLAARIPDSRLARRSRLIVVAVVFLLALSVIPGLCGIRGNFVVVTLVPTIVAVFVLSIWFRRAFRCVAASNASYESLFGNMPTRAALAYADTKTASAIQRRQSIVRKAESTLEVNVPCVPCGYNLRGLSADGRCPECGEAVSESLRRDRLLSADPSWVERIVLGLTLVLVGTTMFWILLPFVPRNGGGSIAEIMLALSQMAMAGVIVVGVFFCTQRESARSNLLHAWITRWAARSLALVWLSCWSAGIALRWGGGVEYPVLVTLRVAAVAGLLVCLFLYLASLASRIPNQRLVTYSQGVTFIVCAFLLSWIARVVFLDESLSNAARISRVTFSATVPDWLGLPLYGFFLATWFGMLVLGWWAVLRYRDALKLVGAATVPFDSLFGDVPTSEVLTPVPASKPDPKSAAKPPEETLCIRCGYNLRGLRSDGKCPECGTSIGRSRQGNLLAAADPSWLGGLCRGLILVIAAVGVHFAGLFLENVGSLVIAELAGREEWIEAVRRGISAVLLLAGVILITKLDPRLTLAEHSVVLRKVARGIATAALLLYILTLSIAPYAPGVLVAGGLGWSLKALFIAAIVSASLYLARLAERIPDEELASSTRSVARKYAVTMPVWLVSSAIAGGLTQPGVPYLVVRGFFILLAICLTPFLLFYIWTLIGLWTNSYRQAFRKCLAEALDRDRAIAERSTGVGPAPPPAS